MQRSEGRILTTHAGSLPRPPELVAMFADCVQGRPVAPEALAAAIEDATAWVLPKQLDAGIDIPNNGEQPRDAFFLYVRHRMSGFAGLGSRQGPADVARYPGFLAMRQQSAAKKVAVTNFDVPKVSGPGALSGPGLCGNRMRRFSPHPDRPGPGAARGLHHRALARHHRRRRAERILR